MLTTFSDTTLSLGAEGMPMLDATISSFESSEELSFRVCRRENVHLLWIDYSLAYNNKTYYHSIYAVGTIYLQKQIIR